MHGKQGSPGQRGQMSFCTDETVINMKEVNSRFAKGISQAEKDTYIPNMNHNVSIGIDISNDDIPTILFNTNNIIPIENDYLLNISSSETSLYKVVQKVLVNTFNISNISANYNDLQTYGEITVPLHLFKLSLSDSSIGLDNVETTEISQNDPIFDLTSISFDSSASANIWIKNNEEIFKKCLFNFILNKEFYSNIGGNVFKGDISTYEIYLIHKLDIWNFSSNIPSGIDLGVAIRSVNLFKHSWQGCYEPHIITKRTLYNSFDEKFKHLIDGEEEVQNGLAQYCVNVLGYSYNENNKLCIHLPSEEGGDLLEPANISPLTIFENKHSYNDGGNTNPVTPVTPPDENEDVDESSGGKLPIDIIDNPVFDEPDEPDPSQGDPGEETPDPPGAEPSIFNPELPQQKDDLKHEEGDIEDLSGLKYSLLSNSYNNDSLIFGVSTGIDGDSETDYRPLNIKLSFVDAITNEPCINKTFTIDLHFGHHHFYKDPNSILDLNYGKQVRTMPITINGRDGIDGNTGYTVEVCAYNSEFNPGGLYDLDADRKFISQINDIPIRTDGAGFANVELIFHKNMGSGVNLSDFQDPVNVRLVLNIHSNPISAFQFLLAYISVRNNENPSYESEYFSSVYPVNKLTWPQGEMDSFICKVLPKNFYESEKAKESDVILNSEYANRANSSISSQNTKFSAITDKFTYIDTSRPSLKGPLVTLEAFLDEDDSLEAQNAFISEREVKEYYTNEEFCPVLPKECTFTQFVISTTLPQKDIKNIKIEAELYDPSSIITPQISTCVNNFWNLSKYTDDELPLNTTAQNFYSKRHAALMQKTVSTNEDLEMFKTTTFNAKYLTPASESKPENDDKLDTTDLNVLNEPLYKYNGFSKNYNYKLNFDNEKIYPCTITIKDFGESVSGTQLISSILVPSESIAGASIKINAYFKTSSSVYSKIVLGDSTIAETFD